MYSIKAVVFLICAAQLTQAASINDIQLRIISEENFATTQVDLFKERAKQSISEARSTLNNKAQGIRTIIQQGPANCQRWLEHIDMLQKSINFLYEFQRCEIGLTNPVRPGEIKIKLFDLKKQADKVQAMCNLLRGFNCQASVNSLEGALDVLHESVANRVERMKVESDQCIADRVLVHNKLLDSALSSIQKCK